MRRNLGTILVAGMIAGALLFPFSNRANAQSGISRGQALEMAKEFVPEAASTFLNEIENKIFYETLKQKKLKEHGEYLEKIVVKRETRFLVSEKYFIKKGKSLLDYLERIKTTMPSGIFKGNELIFTSVCPQEADCSQPINNLSTQEIDIVTEETLVYLKKAYDEGYRGVSRASLNHSLGIQIVDLYEFIQNIKDAQEEYKK